MTLSCSCPDSDDDDVAWVWYSPDDYTTLETKRRKRCKSCGTLIDVGSIVLKFNRARHPRNDVEERIHGEGGEIPMPAWYHCETCADLWFSLTELGFCVAPDEDQRELVREYAAMVAKARK